MIICTKVERECFLWLFVFEQKKKYDRYGLIDASTTYITRMFVNKQEVKH